MTQAEGGNQQRHIQQQVRRSGVVGLVMTLVKGVAKARG